MSGISTPCINVCKTDDNDRCIACGRTLDQIASWGALSEAERLAVMARLRDEGFPRPTEQT